MNGKNNITLGLGKDDKEIFERSVLPFLPLAHTPELDGGFFHSSGEMIVSHSPSIGVPINALGFFGFHYAASNVASKFAVPRFLVIGIYLPLKTREEELKIISKGLGDEASKYNVSVVAGQTATYNGLETILLTVTCLGERTRKPKALRNGDLVHIVGKIGSEAVWLKKTSEGKHTRWDNLTALPAALGLQKCKGVKLMHDVSEGGVKTALYELMESTNTNLSINSCKIPIDEEVELIASDALRAPSYGSLIVVTDSGAVTEVNQVCTELGFHCSQVGRVEAGHGLFIDGQPIKRPVRIPFDRIYGTFSPSNK